MKRIRVGLLLLQCSFLFSFAPRLEASEVAPDSKDCRASLESKSQNWDELVEVARIACEHGDVERLKSVIEIFAVNLKSRVINSTELRALSKLIKLFPHRSRDLAQPLVTLAQASFNYYYADLMRSVVRTVSFRSDPRRNDKAVYAHLLVLQQESPRWALPLRPIEALASLRDAQLIEGGFSQDEQSLFDRLISQLLVDDGLVNQFRLIAALPRAAAEFEWARLRDLVNRVAEWADESPESRDNMWRGARKANQTLLEFAKEITLRTPKPGVDLDVPWSLQKYRGALAMKAIEGGIGATRSVPLILRLEPAPVKSGAFKMMARAQPEVLPDDVMEQILTSWQYSNLATASYYLIARGGLEPLLSFREDFPRDQIVDPPVVDREPENSHYFVTQQLELARFLIKTGERRWIHRGLQIIEDLPSNFNRIPSRYVARTFREPFTSAGFVDRLEGPRLDQSSFLPAEGKINAYLSAARWVPTHARTLILKAYILAEHLPNLRSITPRADGDVLTMSTVCRLILALHDVNESALADKLCDQWAPYFDEENLRSRLPAVFEKSVKEAQVIANFFATVIKTRALQNQTDDKKIFEFTTQLRKRWDESVTPLSSLESARGDYVNLEVRALVQAAKNLAGQPRYDLLVQQALGRAIGLVEFRAPVYASDFVNFLVESNLFERVRSDDLGRIRAIGAGQDARLVERGKEQ